MHYFVLFCHIKSILKMYGFNIQKGGKVQLFWILLKGLYSLLLHHLWSWIHVKTIERWCTKQFPERFPGRTLRTFVLLIADNSTDLCRFDAKLIAICCSSLLNAVAPCLSPGELRMLRSSLHLHLISSGLVLVGVRLKTPGRGRGTQNSRWNL